MSCSGDTSDLLSCIGRVCQAAAASAAFIQGVVRAAQGLEARLGWAVGKIDCVVNGGVGSSCGGIPSLAEAIDRLNADAVDGITPVEITAGAGQISFGLSPTPASAAHVQIAINGATLSASSWSLVGSDAQLVDGAEDGDQFQAWIYSL